jgi:lipopolysaccharide export LptBFGC system permease protein LptF
MWRNRPLIRAWLRDLARPAALTFVGLVMIGVLALGAQTLARTPLIPGAAGIGWLVLGFLPEMAAIALPIALFVGTAVVARRWQEGGEFVGMLSGGAGGRALCPTLLLTGMVGGLVVAALAHGPGPWGRAVIRDVLVGAATHLHVEAGRPMQVGDLFIRVEGVDARGWSNVFLAQDDVVASAPSGGVDADGSVRLEGGTARRLANGDRQGWSLSFDAARFALVPSPARVHTFEMSDARLAGLVERMEARGRSAHSEQLVLYKRTTLAMGVPLMVLLGLPLGVRWQRPGAAVVGTVLSVWVVQRLGDHLAAGLGAGWAAAMPVLFLLLLTGACWWTWSDR